MRDAALRLGLDNLKSSLTQLHGRPGVGTYRLELTFDWTPTRWEQLHDARVVFAGDLEVSFTQGARWPLGGLQTCAVAFASREQGTFPARVDLAVHLPPAQLDALERERDGGPLTLHLKLQGAVLRHAAQGSDGPLAEAFWAELEYRLKPAEWVEVLEQWQYAQGFLLQVPKFAKSHDSARALRASGELEKAIKDMNEGRFRDAIATCRDALEMAYGDADKDLHPELGYKVPGLHDADKQARFWLVRRAVWAVAHAAKHRDETTHAIEWGRRDAQALILLLAALLEHDPPV